MGEGWRVGTVRGANGAGMGGGLVWGRADMKGGLDRKGRLA